MKRGERVHARVVRFWATLMSQWSTRYVENPNQLIGMVFTFFKLFKTIFDILLWMDLGMASITQVIILEYISVIL